MTVKEIKEKNKELKKLIRKIINILNENIDSVSLDIHMKIIGILVPYMYEMDLREYKNEV